MIQQSRRGFIKTLTVSGALLVGFRANVLWAQPVSWNSRKLGLYVRLDPDGAIAIGSPSSEIGQGTWTSIPMLIAEELDVDFDRVSVEPINLILRRDSEGTQPAVFTTGAGGSDAISDSWLPARQAGATARQLLRSAAARLWGVPIDQVTTTDGVLFHEATGRRANYGAMLPLAIKEELPEGDIPLKGKSEMTIIGTPRGDKQAGKIVRGEPLFGIDQRYPGMVYAVIARAPRFDSEVMSVDESETRKIPGVLRIVRVPGPGPGGDFNQKPIANGVAVVAKTLWSAIKGRDALRVTWTEGPMAGISSADIRATARRQLDAKGEILRNDGDVAAGFAAAERKHEAEYELPIVSHAALEPPGCIADVREDGCTIVGSTQDPWGCMLAARSLTGLDPLKIEVRNIRSGGGFGRRLDTDYAAEAVYISKEIGMPVRVHWSREDALRHDFYRPLVHHRLSAGLDSRGRILAWRHGLASTARFFRRGVPPERFHIPEYWVDDLPGRLIENMEVAYHFVETAIPFGPWRAPGHTANAFAVQSFIDELANLAGADPVRYRLDMLGPPRTIPYEQHGGPTYDTGRHSGVIRLAAEKAGWGEPLGRGRGRGFATHFTFGTYGAHVVDITMGSDGNFSVDRVVSAFDCGVVVNPNGARAQNEGGINDALSAALGQEITVTNGRVDQGNFDTYSMMRFDRAAKNIETHFVDSAVDPRGMGEPPVPPLAPALANAIFDATGQRIRRLPIASQLAGALPS